MRELDEDNHAVAVVSIGLLLRKNGVMEKLTAQGLGLFRIGFRRRPPETERNVAGRQRGDVD